MRILFLFLIFIFSQQSYAQIDPFMQDYQKALADYHNGAYSKAYNAFSTLNKSYHDAHSLIAIETSYYKCRSAMQLFHADADSLMLGFLDIYSNSTLYDEATRNLADYYYQKRDYNNAAFYYQKVDVLKLDKNFLVEYKFKHAYSLFELREMKKAALLFHDVRSDQGPYQDKSNYYFGYIAFIDGNHATAKDIFIELIDKGLYLDELPLYVMQINHEYQNYEALISFFSEYIDSVYQGSIEIYKLLAEAYFYQEDFVQCIHYFVDVYITSGGELDDFGHYLLGQAYYRTREYSLASSSFNKIIAAEDSLAQNAYYYLADCYLELGDKRSAQNAFESASYFDFNPSITEHSNFNFAKLCYELGYPYADPTMILQDFINDFPNSEYIDETYSFLVNAFLTHKDYSSAISSMEANGLENLRLQQAYQEVSYYRAVQLFNDGKYHQALEHFEKALIHTFNKNLQALTHYWKAETFYRLEDYENSILSFKDFKNTALASSMSEYQSSFYHIGYSYFKLWKFQESIRAMEQFLSNTTSSDFRLHDAYVRMGDSHYMLKEYQNAITDYEKAVQLWGVDSDYAAYQIALAYQQMDAYQEVVDQLLGFESAHPKSTYRDDAIYRMGEAYIKLNAFDDAISMFSSISSKFPSSPYVADAKMKIGLVYYNSSRYPESIQTFKSIVADYPSTAIAREAITNARSAYIDLGDVTSYVDWLETLSFVNMSTAAIDSTTYESAELQYLKGDYNKAFKSFQGYIASYSDGIFNLPAQYYFAQSALKIDSTDQALQAFDRISTLHHNTYTYIAIKQSAILYQQKERYGKAIDKYILLDDLAETIEEQLFAKQGLMACYMEEALYDKAIEQAQLVLNSGRVDQELILELNIFIARASYLNLDRHLAQEKYDFVRQNCEGDMKAEAMYYLAYIYFYEGQYEQSKNMIFEQSRILASYKYWLGKSFLVLAKNYLQEEDVFQATHTLDQLILNIKDPSIVKEARSLKADILVEENKEVSFSLGLDSLSFIDSIPAIDTISERDTLKIIEE